MSAVSPDSVRDALLSGALVMLVAGCGTPAPAQSPYDTGAGATGTVAADTTWLSSELAAVRQATERFRDVDIAIAEGYVRDPADMCITAPMEGQPAQLGGMGIHFFRPDLLSITGIEPRVAGTGTHTDFTMPSLLIYEPQADGSLELVAIENLVFLAGWERAGNTEPPSFLGNEFYLMSDNPNTPVDEAHGFEPHYELHLWLYRPNPNGMFAQFNPNVTCAHHGGHAGAH